jgi:hypothetical protein
VTGGRAVGGGGAAGEGAVPVGVAGWEGVTVWTGRSVAPGDGVVSDGRAAVRGGISEKQSSTCGICRFSANTKAQLLARVASL